MLFRLLTTAVLAGALATPAWAVPAPADLLFDFDTDAQGWTVLFDGTLTHEATGGQSGGYLRLTDTSTNTDFELAAPASLAGNLSAYLGGTLQFQARNLDVLPDWPDFGRITLTGAGMTVSFDGVPADQPPPDPQWHTYSVRLTTDNFTTNLPTVLADLTQLSIKTEFHQGLGDDIGIDNIRISAVPESPTWALLLAGGLLLPALYRRRC
jgi:hypothetical protein